MRTFQRSPFTGLVTWLSLAFLLIPLAVVILFSFHSTSALSFPFAGFSLRWYRELFDSAEFLAAAKNSLIVATSVAIATGLIGTGAAYGITSGSSRWRGPLTVLFFLPITVPPLFIGIALLVGFSLVDWKLSLVTVAIAHFVFVFPFFLLLGRAALDRLDSAQLESAADLGANRWQVFRLVTLPQIWPVLIGATILAFALSFDEFIITFFVIGSGSTIPLFIWSGLRRTIDPTLNTVSTLLLGLTLTLGLITFLISRWLQKSRTSSLEEVI